jgi:hypothetical protein
LTLAVAALGVGVASAAKPTAKSSVSIHAAPNRVVYGSSLTIAGSVTGNKTSGVTVTLFAGMAPSYSPAKAVANTATDANGRYTFKVAPSVNTIYVVKAHTAPLATSPQVKVQVKIRITLRVSTNTPTAGHRVRFSGFVLPDYSGRTVLIQRNTGNGWRTVGHATLATTSSVSTALGSTTRAKYSRQLKVLKTATYRAHFNPADGLRTANNSARRRLNVS